MIGSATIPNSNWRASGYNIQGIIENTCADGIASATIPNTTWRSASYNIQAIVGTLADTDIATASIPDSSWRSSGYSFQTFIMRCDSPTSQCSDCPGVKAGDAPFTTITQYQYFSSGQLICKNNPQNIIRNGKCWTFVREVKFSDWKVSADKCSGWYDSATVVSGQSAGSLNFAIFVRSIPTCGKLLTISLINNGATFDLSTFPTNEYYDGLDVNNPSNFDELYIFT